jgi:hypothetical protein
MKDMAMGALGARLTCGLFLSLLAVASAQAALEDFNTYIGEEKSLNRITTGFQYELPEEKPWPSSSSTMASWQAKSPSQSPRPCRPT